MGSNVEPRPSATTLRSTPDVYDELQEITRENELEFYTHKERRVTVTQARVFLAIYSTQSCDWKVPTRKH